MENSDSGEDAIWARKGKDSNAKEWTGRESQVVAAAHGNPEDHARQGDDDEALG